MKKVYFYVNFPLIWLSYKINSITFLQKKTMTLKMLNSKYYSIDQIQTLKFPDNYKSLPLFHINACSLNKSFDDRDHLLKSTNNLFDLILVSETKITKQTSLTTKINLKFISLSLCLLNLQLGAHSSTLLFLYLINHVLILIFINLTS